MKLTSIHRAAVIATLAIAAAACIKNDIPYPRIQANFTSIEAVGQSSPAHIDSTNRAVTIFLPEDANIYEVSIKEYTLSPNTEIVSGDLSQPLDLSKKYTVVLRMYQDYAWSIAAQQDIERYFTVEGQIGASTIDVPGRRVVATVSDQVNLEALYVESCKLGPQSATVDPNIQGRTVDFSHPVKINLENYGHIEQWTIYIDQTEASVVTTRADGWTNVAWVYGEGKADADNGVEYRIKGDTEWLKAPSAWVHHDGGTFYARLVGLTPQTTYEARATSGSDAGDTLEFTTGTVIQMPNSDFDNWWLDGKVWCPWAEGGSPYWGTGNKGATTLGNSNTVPTDDTVTGQGQAALLQTKFVGLGMIGKLAAGNIFVGSYVRTDGTNGILSFGRDFTERPTKLKGYWKYQTAPISSASTEFSYMKGQPDTCTVWVALIDSAEPFEIRTNPNNRQLFDPEGSYVVAYGSIQSGSDIPAYAPFEIELKYTSTERKPKYILCVASASKYGDYFTGGNGAMLYVDNFTLDYDY